MMDIFFDALLNMARAYDFGTANDFAKFIVNADDEISQLLNEKQCFSLLAGIYKAKTYGATHSERIVNNNFNSIPKIREKALKGSQDEKELCQKILKDIVGDDYLNIDNFLPHENE